VKLVETPVHSNVRLKLAIGKWIITSLTWKEHKLVDEASTKRRNYNTVNLGNKCKLFYSGVEPKIG